MNRIDAEHAFGVFFAFAFLGPLVGGLPYAWMIFTIPFAFLIGGIPSIIGAALFAYWLWNKPLPKSSKASMYGAAFGAIGALLGSAPVIFVLSGSSSVAWNAEDLAFVILVNLPHAIIAGAMIAGFGIRLWHWRIERKIANRLIVGQSDRTP